MLAPFGFLLALQRRGLRWGKNVAGVCGRGGGGTGEGKQALSLVPLAHTVFLPARHRVISETKVEVGIDLRHF